MSQAQTVLCIGKATQDVFLRDDEFDPTCKGRVCYTHLPLGSKIDVSELYFSTGGNATNVAVTLARQGLHARYLWALGLDPASEASLKALDEEGVDTSAVVQFDRYYAGYSTILVAASNGERTILNHKGSMPTASDVERMLRLVELPDWVYPTSVGSIDTLEKIISWAKKHAVKIMLNPAATELQDSSRLRALLPHVDVLCMNKEEMQQLIEGRTSEELVRHGLHYCPVVIVTDGQNGAVASDGKQIVIAGLYHEQSAVERTGAGDAFGAGFLSQWVQGFGLERSLHVASANSSNVVMQIGAKTGILESGAPIHDMPMKVKEL